MPSEKIIISLLSALAHYHHPVCQQRNQFLAQQQKNWQNAAVLLALIPIHERWHIMLTQRSRHLRHHSGQIALAGGKQDRHDADLTATALREAYEETHAPHHIWHTFHAMPPFYSPTGFAVYPIPAYCNNLPDLYANPNEVAEIFYLPLSFALNLHNYQHRPTHFHNQILPIPALPYLHHDIWGLTATILYTLANCAHEQAIDIHLL